MLYYFLQDDTTNIYEDNEYEDDKTLSDDVQIVEIFSDTKYYALHSIMNYLEPLRQKMQ